MAEIVSIEQWEHCKENILPVKSGRKASALSKVFGSTTTDNEFENERKEFERRIEEANKSEDEDTLSIWLEYYEWAKETFPSSNSESLKIVQIATKTFRNNPQYQQDERYLRLWVIYVSSLQK